MNKAMNRFLRLVVFGSSLAALSVRAHQPIMDMAPRWSGGWGLQIRQVWYGSDDYLDGSTELSNPDSLERYVRQTWLEGVYTFDRSVRVTFKVPYVEKSRTILSGGTPARQESNGWGDLVLAFPLKKYSNFEGYTHNFGFTPQVRIPTGSSRDDYALSDGSWDSGLALSYSGEGYLFDSFPNLHFYQLYDLFYWENNKGTGGMNEGDELGLDVNVGMKLYHDNDSLSGAFLMWDMSARRQEVGDARTGAYNGKSLQTGPVLVWYKDGLMIRGEWKASVYESLYRPGIARGSAFELGMGISF
jgi:hypothetical protein